MCMDDLGTFAAHGYDKHYIGKLATYGCVLHSGVPWLFQGVANLGFGGCLSSAVEGKVFLDLGSADGRCVISAALHFGGLRSATGIELSFARHEVAMKHKARISDEEFARKIRFIHDDVLSEATAKLVAESDVLYFANLTFPEEVNRKMGSHL